MAFRIFIVISGNRFEKFRDQKVTCSRNSIYTKINSSCDGWSGMPLDSCKEKCSSNSLPQGCTKNNETCRYVVWNPDKDWCHLANESCVEEAVNMVLQTYKLIGKFTSIANKKFEFNVISQRKISMHVI